MISAMYEVQLADARRRELFAGARAYRQAKLARRRSRGGRHNRRSMTLAA
jgi:hypothetical protein